MSKTVVGLVLLVVACVLQPFVLRDLWGWFVVPLGVRPLGLIHAWGLQSTITYFSMTSLIYSAVSDGEKKRELLERVIVLLFAETLFWSFGWVMSHWV
jgi:hypothetical protein